MSPTYACQIFSDSDLQFLNGSHFGNFLLYALLSIWVGIETSSLIEYAHMPLIYAYYARSWFP